MYSYTATYTIASTIYYYMVYSVLLLVDTCTTYTVILASHHTQPLLRTSIFYHGVIRLSDRVNYQAIIAQVITVRSSPFAVRRLPLLSLPHDGC